MHQRLLTFIVLQMATLIRNELLTSEQRYIALCLRSVIRRNFTPGQSLIVSFPKSGCQGSQTSPKCDSSQLVNFVLENTHQDVLWPLQVFQTEFLNLEMSDEQLRIHHNYVIFTWPEEFDVIGTLVTQLEKLQSVVSWNPRAKFFIVVTENYISPANILALNICETMWNINRIVNVVVMVPDPDYPRLGARIHILNLYTWFPYEAKSCAKLTNVVLMDQCLPDGDGQLSNNALLFPNKIPNNLQGCPIRVSTSELIPYVISTNTYVDSDGSTVYNYRGLEIEYLLLLTEAANLTVVYLPLAEGDVKDTHLQQLVEVSMGISDVAIGHFPLNSILIPFADPTITIVFDDLRWYVPCPKPVPRVEKVMGLYTLPVWFCIALVFILTALTFWLSANAPNITLVTESSTYRDMLQCICVVWCVSLGTPVPKMPRSPKLRALFTLLLCYCFVMGIVAQAFFVSFLINPGYHNDINNFDELVESGLVYGKEDSLEFFLRLADYHEQEMFRSHVDCSDRHKCLERLFVEGDITMLSPIIDVVYVLSHMGMAKIKKVLCTLNDNVFPLDISIYLTKGHPLLDLFNVAIRRCTESGLVVKYWSDLIFYTNLQNVDRFKERGCEVCSDMYFVFTLSHLKVSFFVLVFGLVVGFIVFVAELVYRCRSESHRLSTSKYGH
ncbi:uncharacterized protein LOC110831897 isoform X2 [Zootermopsis nevadensis]|uniref:Putative ionotropic receptor ligand binding domain-containing protein n=2 Tax=Zootermopsis nevadensis TaxID=136037 RepID=A0A067REB1_ZOONE|nr:uncharacterized protein LOC110831897 isoform X2 [Zootermopsis nevadensis]KDR17223.1 hypothetical protein L798_08950 [Zootermopsis nevadensis]